MSSDQTPTAPLQYRTSEGVLLAWDGTRWVPSADAADAPARPPAWVLGCTCGAERDALPATESTASPHGDADATDATLILANRIHQVIGDAGHDCPEDALCWEIAQALITDGTPCAPTPWPVNVVCGDTGGPAGVGGECVLPPGHPHCDGIGGQWTGPVAAVLALADALDTEAHDRATGVSVERRATKIQAAARIRRVLGGEASDARD